MRNETEREKTARSKTKGKDVIDPDTALSRAPLPLHVFLPYR